MCVCVGGAHAGQVAWISCVPQWLGKLFPPECSAKLQVLCHCFVIPSGFPFFPSSDIVYKGVLKD